MRARTSFRCWPSWPSSSRRRQASGGLGVRAAMALAWSFNLAIGRSSRNDSTPSSTAMPNSACTSTSHSTVLRRSTSRRSISPSSNHTRRRPMALPSCRIGVSRCAMRTLSAQRRDDTASGRGPGLSSATSAPHTLFSRSKVSTPWRSAVSFTVHSGSASTSAPSSITASRLRCTSGSCVRRAMRWSSASSPSAGTSTPSTMASSTVLRIDSDSFGGDIGLRPPTARGADAPHCACMR